MPTLMRTLHGETTFRVLFRANRISKRAPHYRAALTFENELSAT